jgi:hypothetical protein
MQLFGPYSLSPVPEESSPQIFEIKANLIRANLAKSLINFSLINPAELIEYVLGNTGTITLE